jgi:hypothetical protein
MKRSELILLFLLLNFTFINQLIFATGQQPAWVQPKIIFNNNQGKTITPLLNSGFSQIQGPML